MQSLMDEAAQARLQTWLSGALGCAATITAITPLKGGGIQENWTVEARVEGAAQRYVLRKDAPATIDASHSRRHEFAIIEAAHKAGVTVPEESSHCNLIGSTARCSP